MFWALAEGDSQLSSVVEQRFCKPSVVGSNPTAGSIPAMVIGEKFLKCDGPRAFVNGRRARGLCRLQSGGLRADAADDYFVDFFPMYAR